MTVLVLCVQLLYIFIQSIKPLFPDLAVVFGPIGHFFQGTSHDSTPSPLRVPSLRDQSCAFQCTKILRRPAYSSQTARRVRQPNIRPKADGPGWLCESGPQALQTWCSIDPCPLYLTNWLINLIVLYTTSQHLSTKNFMVRDLSRAGSEQRHREAIDATKLVPL
jgi:hypothetical protein